jgi:hypothetical protein
MERGRVHHISYIIYYLLLCYILAAIIYRVIGSWPRLAARRQVQRRLLNDNMDMYVGAHLCDLGV